MAYEKRDNSGALFKNDRKESDKHPDYKGDLSIDGRDYWVSAWIKKSAKGMSFMSLATTPKENNGGAQAPATKPTSNPTDEPDVPF